MNPSATGPGQPRPRADISRLEGGGVAQPARTRLQNLAAALGTTTADLLAAALDRHERARAELPELSEYLRRKYSLDPPGIAPLESALAGLRDVD